MTTTILESRDWITLGLFLFAFVGALVIAFSYRYFRRKPAPPTLNRLAYLAQKRRDYADDRMTQMNRHRADVAEHFGQKHHH